jgi:Fur family ferric uptake transcriptional regulator
MKSENFSLPLVHGRQYSASPLALAPEKLIHREPVGEANLKRMIRSMGIKVTLQRMAILNGLIAGRAHVTAQEVFEKIHDSYPEMGFATVYRFLRKLVEAGLVTEVRVGGLPARYELATHRHHDHLTCESCSKIIEFEDPEIEALQKAVAKKYGFVLTHHLLELYGRCAICAQQK